MTKMEERRVKAFERTRQKHVGKKYNMLTVIDIIRYNDRGEARCWVICECGVEKECDLWRLSNYKVISCGCEKTKLVSDKIKTHGLSAHPLYTVWEGIKLRCYNKNCVNYHLYGGKGICMCEEWRTDFYSFYLWAIANSWEKGLTVDRFPNKNGNYEPSNCRITTYKKNANNKENNRIINVMGEKMTVSEASDKFNIPVCRLRSRLRSGWNGNDAVFKPRQNWIDNIPKK